jgi:hypothetical protein
VTSPSPQFLNSGKNLRKGDVFDFDLKRVTDTAKNEAKRIKGFSGNCHVVALDMEAYPTPLAGKWFFIVTVVDDHKNIAKIIVNSEGKAWPFGIEYDAFDAKSEPRANNKK